MLAHMGEGGDTPWLYILIVAVVVLMILAAILRR